MKNFFTDHPSSINETYFQHLLFAATFGCKMILAGTVSLIHAIFPFLFEKTASQMINKIYQQLNSRNTTTHGQF